MTDTGSADEGTSQGTAFDILLLLTIWLWMTNLQTDESTSQGLFYVSFNFFCKSDKPIYICNGNSWDFCFNVKEMLKGHFYNIIYNNYILQYNLISTYTTISCFREDDTAE